MKIHTNLIFIGLLLIVLVLGCTQQTTTETTFETTTDQQTNTEVTIIEKDERTDSEEGLPEPEPVKTQGDLYLISDKENSRVIKVTSEGEIVWQYGCDSVNDMGYCSYGLELLNKPHHASFSGDTVLIADKDNNRVIQVNEAGKIIWEYTALNKPNSVVELSNGNLLIADGMDNRVIEVTKAGKEIVWQYGCTQLNSAGKCAYGTDPGYLRNPNFATMLSNGNILITDTENNRILEIDNQDTVWEFKSGLNIPQSAHRTDKGTTIIANYRNNEVLEVNMDKEVIWEFDNIRIPTFAYPTEDGILMVDSFNNQIIEVNTDGEILTQINNTIEDHQPLFPLFRPQSVAN